jgi:hypothetical protein
LKAFLDVEPVDQLVIHWMPLSPQEYVQPTVAVVHPTGRQVPQPYPELGPIVADALVAMRRTRKSQRPACSTLAHLVAYLEFLYQGTSTIGLQSFFDSTS